MRSPRSNALRSFNGGRLNLTDDNLLPIYDAAVHDPAHMGYLSPGLVRRSGARGEGDSPVWLAERIAVNFVTKAHEHTRTHAHPRTRAGPAVFGYGSDG